ncbi:MAG: PaaI family thioesterase [Candidatus Thermoplasmatota archaeon]|nr:PaaI family thioesterase [Candidatus Thermoplasmatota archaeon]MCL5730597.1 PaaI family thioesterase [Candidatus Thermoplasmatota archaeon]
MNFDLPDINKILETDPFLKPLRMKVVSRTEYEIVIEMPFTETVKRIGEIMNGGAIMTLADVAGGFSLLFDRDVLNQVTINLSINFIRPISNGPVIARGKKLRSGKTVGFSEVDIYDGSGKLCAKANGSWYLFRSEP